MAIAFRNSAVSGNNTTTSFTITIPSDTVANDILILAATNRDSDADPSVTDNDSGGNAWAKVGGTGCHTVWWKRATSATASKVITASGFTGSCAGVLKTYSGCRQDATPYEGVTAEANASGDESHAAITPTRDGSMIILCIGNDTNDLATTTHTATNPATLSLVEKLNAGGSDCSSGQAHGIQTGSAGSTGTLNWAQTNAASVSVVLALMPNRAFTLTADQGSYTYTGQATGLAFNRLVTAVQGSYTYTGSSATLTYTPAGATYTLLAAQGIYTYTGQAASVTFNRLLTAVQGSYTLTGFDTGLRFGRRLAPDAGAYAYTGFAVNLDYSGGGPGGMVRVFLQRDFGRRRNCRRLVQRGRR